MSTTRQVIPDESQIERVRGDLRQTSLVAQAGASQAMELASGAVEGETPSLSQIGALSLLAFEMETQGRLLAIAAHRLREAIVDFDADRQGLEASVDA